jgi:F-type H+-transporting ATPase subunit b
MDQMVHINQLIAHVLSFIVFFFLVRGAFLAIIYPPMKERRDRIAAEQEGIEKEKAEAVRLRQEYEAHLKRIEAESRERIHNAVTEGQQLAAEIREIARTEAQEMITRAREEISLERDKAQVAIKNEVVELAMAIATKVVQEELTADRHKKLVDSFLAEVGQGR